MTSSWEVLHGSVQGPRKQLCQDRMKFRRRDGDVLVLAVADGHGARAHRYSHIGARLAVDAFLEVVDQAPEITARWARRELGALVVHRWNELVAQHHHREPPLRQPDLELYGTTLIGGVLAPHATLACQIGDGDLCVVIDGEVHMPLRAETAAFGDETDSLCSANARHLARIWWEPHRRPGLVTLSTDGLSNSFADPAGFGAFVSGLRDRLAERGADPVQQDLPGWLDRAASYSGDDTTLLAAWRAAPQDDEEWTPHPMTAKET
ncbi:serine/threonine protein phosphatase PrpC [Actinocorallia herbida]|uniref:Serine/threonine protein phosphatase PrpC n=1 Tax=Actinocorallia herbida TaxID=58109 RepID=A0A3N1CU47_9ACTN|nr:PP2C family serine/threonine-protein phosphatase [Actinocorallia herbida]ROO84833.1 serine/threonine protein phosphatase PrpC [Actinocorallia herbida]